MTITLSKEQSRVLVMLSGQQNQLLTQASEVQAAYKAQLELLKAFYKVEGEVQAVVDGDHLVLEVMPEPVPAQEGEDVSPPA